MENIDWIYDLRPVNFSYKSDKDNRKQYGLIAEEVEMVNPSFVGYNSKGEIETVQYNQFISPMIKAIQEQKVQIDQQKKEISAQKQEINLLKEELSGLRELIESFNH